ncbi:MAG: hypothetical protein M2R45_03696 [Verrucomicrobia subdivision 3 bacterium]|nr:hypothetical protein [Limisphaerales bacterium]MCS1414979.1 hypothetical protein [Limisphaerales bacterium]
MKANPSVRFLLTASILAFAGCDPSLTQDTPSAETAPAKRESQDVLPPYVFGNGVLRGMKSVNPMILINDNLLKEGIKKDRFQTELELILRSSRIPIDATSPNDLWLTIEAMKHPSLPQFIFSINLQLYKTGRFANNEFTFLTAATIWKIRWYGYCGESMIEEKLMDHTEQCAKKFANDFLAANE